MKSQAKASPQRSRFASRSPSRFSPISSTPASASAPISSSGTYLPATQDLDRRARPPRAPASRFARTRVGVDVRGTARPSGGRAPGDARPAGRCGRRCRGGRRAGPGCSACRGPRRSISATPARSSSSPRDRAAGRASGPRRGRRRAARRPRGPRRPPRSSRVRSPGPIAAAVAPISLDAPGRRSRRPGRASRRGASRRPPGPASAIGRQSATKTSQRRGPSTAVTWPSTFGGAGLGPAPARRPGLRASWRADLAAVDLAADHDDALGIEPQRRAEPAAVLEHAARPRRR